MFRCLTIMPWLPGWQKVNTQTKAEAPQRQRKFRVRLAAVVNIVNNPDSTFGHNHPVQSGISSLLSQTKTPTSTSRASSRLHRSAVPAFLQNLTRKPVNGLNGDQLCPPSPTCLLVHLAPSSIHIPPLTTTSAATFERSSSEFVHQSSNNLAPQPPLSLIDPSSPVIVQSTSLPTYQSVRLNLPKLRHPYASPRFVHPPALVDPAPDCVHLPLISGIRGRKKSRPTFFPRRR